MTSSRFNYPNDRTNNSPLYVVHACTVPDRPFFNLHSFTSSLSVIDAQRVAHGVKWLRIRLDDMLFASDCAILSMLNSCISISYARKGFEIKFNSSAAMSKAWRQSYS
jgi:hypothetical protein